LRRANDAADFKWGFPDMLDNYFPVLMFMLVGLGASALRRSSSGV